MNGKEALKEMLDGKKISSNYFWGVKFFRFDFSCLRFQTELKNGEKEYNLHRDFIGTEDFKLYVEPINYLTHKETIELLLDGKEICRKYGEINYTFKLGKDGFIINELGDYASPFFFPAGGISKDNCQFYEKKENEK